MANTDPVTIREFAELLSAGAGVRIAADQVSDSTTFDELGVDSLALLGVVSVLERTREMELPADVELAGTVRKFLTLVNGQLPKGD
jgi:minimal PKS acyl carrier protein